MIKTAMVMAAGHGTRMRPLTNDRSKAMVEVAGKPLIDHMLDRLEAVGVEKAVVNVHAHADHLEAHLKTRKGHLEIVISDERDALLETGGGVVKALPLLGNDPVFICNIDAVWIEYKFQQKDSPIDLGLSVFGDEMISIAKHQEPILRQMIKAWDSGTMDDLLLLVPPENTIGYDGQGDFDVGFDNHLTRRSGLRPSFVYAGVQISSLDRFHNYPCEKFSRNIVWKKSISLARAFGFQDGHFFWMHVGDPRAKVEAEAKIREFKNS